MLPTSSVLQIAASPKLAVTMQNKQMLIDKPLGFAPKKDMNKRWKGKRIGGDILSNHCVSVCAIRYILYIYVYIYICDMMYHSPQDLNCLLCGRYCHLHSHLERSAQAPPLWWGLWWTSVCLHRLLPPTWLLGLLLTYRTYRTVMHLWTDCCIAIVVSLVDVHVLSSSVVMSCLWRGM